MYSFPMNRPEHPHHICTSSRIPAQRSLNFRPDTCKGLSFQPPLVVNVPLDGHWNTLFQINLWLPPELLHLIADQCVATVVSRSDIVIVHRPDHLLPIIRCMTF